MMDNRQVSLMLGDGTFIRNNKVYTITNVSTVILMINVLFRRQICSETLLTPTSEDQDSDVPFLMMSQIVDGMLENYEATDQ